MEQHVMKRLILCTAVAILGAACGGSGSSSDGSALSGRLPDGQIVIDQDRALLRGVVTAKTPTSSLTIAGHVIDTSRAQFRDTLDNALTPAAFFAAVTTGKTVVKVRWRPFIDASKPVEEAEIEEPENQANGVPPGPGGVCPAGLELDDGVCKPHGGVNNGVGVPPAPGGACPPGLELDDGVCKPHGGNR
jgi:hypothetical protein